MVLLDAIVSYTNELLDIQQYRDYCPNGLQVQGKNEVQTVISGVTASQAFLDAAIKAGADALLVHHGYFWNGEDPCVVGMKKQRLAKLLASDVSLLAYHLPLDAHVEYGNNAQLAKILELNIDGSFGRTPGDDLGLYGSLPSPIASADFVQLLKDRLGREPMHISGGADPIRSVAWCTGAAQSYIEQAVSVGVDAFISGEISEQTVHVARELGIHYFAAGHHATERYGVQALGEHIAQHFGIQHQFVDVDNPV